MPKRLLLVSSMYPGAADPDLGIFVKEIGEELERNGWTVALAVVRHRGGLPLKHVVLAGEALVQARRFDPDVVFAHFLVPGGAVGAVAARAAGARLVLGVHGKDVRNIGAVPGLRTLSNFAAARAEKIVVLSDFMRRELVSRLPRVDGRVEVIPYGVDLDVFHGRDAAEARERVGWTGAPPFLLCVGGLAERKNVVRLAEAFERLGRGSLVFVGDGELRSRLEGRARVRVVGRVPHERVVDWLVACDVLCQPALVEPFGQALLEAMACERTVVATCVGGPAEFVPEGAGVLVEPTSVDALEAGLRRALELPSPNPAARAAAARLDIRRQGARISRLLEGLPAE